MTPHSMRNFRTAASTLSAGSIGPGPVWQLTAVLQADEEGARPRYRTARLSGAPLPAVTRAGLPAAAPGPSSMTIGHRARIFMRAAIASLFEVAAMINPRHLVGELWAPARQRRLRLAEALAVTLLLVIASSAAAQPFPGRTWEKVDPARAGWSMAKLETARRYFEKIGSTAVMIVQDGMVVASWGDVRKKVPIHSVRKSILSALYGIAVANKQINLDATLAGLGIDDKPPRLTANERRASVRDLLMARSGIYHAAAYETETMRALRPERGSHPAGSFFFYNNWDFNVLGTILRNATGQDTFAAVEQWIARPLQLEDFSAADGKYVYDKSSDHPAYTMQFTARDLARFGWLYLQRGKWRDRVVVPSEWMVESTSPLTHNVRPGVAYGYLWWVSERGKQFRSDTGRGSFSARGSGGQYIVVAPRRRIVVVHLNDTTENEKLASHVFSELLQRIFDAAPPVRFPR